MGQPQANPNQAIVLFDGDCHFCNQTVLFITDRDPKGYFAFAPLQSRLGQQLLGRHAPAADAQAVVLVEEGRVRVASDAALGIARRLRRPWPLLYPLRWLPRSLRDALYHWFARRRYRWFGIAQACRLPTPDLQRRMLVTTPGEPIDRP